MQTYTLIAPAKINLYLEIIGTRPDGYHELAMVLQSVDLADRIAVRANGTDEIRIHCDHPQVPLDKSNLAYRAAQLMAEQFPDSFENFGGADITIHKHIPVAAGLAGGSTDAAAVLVGLDLMWELGLTSSELQELGGRLGSDVPFCIAGGTALATGRGDALSPLPDLTHLYVVLAKYRSLEVSTAWAYQTFRQQFSNTYVSDLNTLENRRQRVHSGPMVNAIARRDGTKIGQLLHNDLERVVLPAYPQVSRLRQAFEQSPVLGAMMSGSGPTVFAVTESQAQAQQVKEAVKAAIPDPDLEVWVAKFISTGIQLASPLK
ncbi:4-(cytidine 5'-diphospho)-2-C-methyl-D-erythritol kinase [Microcoleus sp. FACHB-68]|uniref:4-(cytidine 5'-diphospho)-2-C-methyl-D-erythritol kinase n=1 Tax=Microcoleus sp. FACHB-68 TaxID=2692826 RepID=UPI00168309CF|nr:4-(cytidine 5'-diphospho)-2-C-methyl-D-erythritol kinase [Microcoleus sp. FACHB-68]MBD1939117.1 4-(cytidine 5'-diphospho)-2-C-methyl-D-erythritol kinase [Microcoleus sp. FACHB-68]